MAAFTSGNSEKALQMLIDAGANVNLADKNGVTPLMFAASKGLTEDVKALIHAGADVNVRLSDGQNGAGCGPKRRSEGAFAAGIGKIDLFPICPALPSDLSPFVSLSGSLSQKGGFGVKQSGHSGVRP